ncbi:MAG: GxGYxYP family putative glycoside hydrolase [Clostridia bacterium]
MNSKRRTSWDADNTFLTKRVPLGKAWVVDLKNSTSAEILFMRTFQGMVNRNEARMYLINSDSSQFGPADRFWIEEYERQGWVDIGGYLTRDEALEKFGSEISGYVAATEKEPWTIHAATVIAILKNGIVAPDGVAEKLKKRGWKELDNMCGRWSDAVSAFNEMVNEHRDDLAYPGLALLRPSEGLWDFIVQQQIMPVFSRPKHDTWEGVARIMDTYPGKQILYGYVSDDTVEEEIAVERASSSGKYLVPTHEVSNLSFHSAVMGNSPVKSVRKKRKRIPKLDVSKVNVAIAITDGDNLQVPILQYPTSKFWNTEERGVMPLGWSMGVSLSTLAPGIWEYYRKSISENDEIVSIMGIAYVHASTLPEPDRYFGATFSSMTDMGLHTLWSLDSSLTITDEPLWDMLENASSRSVLKGVLVGYGPSIDKAFRRDTGTPVMITQNGYSEDAERIKDRIEAMLAMEPSERSPVNFLMATNWSTDAEKLYKTLKPLEQKGVRFLTPAQALELMPKIQGMAKSSVDIAAAPGMCLPAGSMKKFGSPILSAPTLAEINKPIQNPISIKIEGPVEGSSDETIAYIAMVEINTNDIARDFLNNRVLPVVEGYGLSEEFAELAWMKLEVSDINLVIPLSENATIENIDIEVTGTKASACVMGSSLRIVLESFTADSRTMGPEIKASVKFSVIRTTGKAGESITMNPESVAFDFALTVGIGKEKGPLVGGVKGKMAGIGTRKLMEITMRS